MANDRGFQFLTGVLGKDGAHAFQKAMARDPAIGAAVLPRAILSWVSLAADGYEGQIPGVDNTYLSFKKTEAGYSGSVTVGQDVYRFHRAGVYHLAGAVSVALGVEDVHVDAQTRSMTLQRLGKSVDALVKARVAVESLTKKPEESSSSSIPAAKKVELPGQANKPTAQAAAQGPTPPEFQPKTPKPLKKPGLKVTKSESERVCRFCGRPQFHAGGFTGCLCFSAMAKSVTTVQTALGYTLEFSGPDWDADAIQALNSVLKGS